MLLPIRVSETGERLPPTGIDPYTLPWVRGAAGSVPGIIRRRYRNPSDDWPLYGPKRRPTEFVALRQKPFPAGAQVLPDGYYAGV